ncbi:hypothetical protein JY651_43115 [Pyxidicoccus parkwayensis]|uniref:MerC mercury resistance protein n=1 Tax=Pyxidicoccus parkwayensis TaxID=2813578 RepID=A0ABX7NWW8_9BACT|nr:hypothetical protein [Pyxidicoccus parkwaysis]QSQ21871.1 hypothetical protein JY651_43115 [Pyxidicoccus parkwaysis]
MRTSLHRTRTESRVKRTALLPLLLGVLVPKCPVCLAVYLSAIGTGASAARDAAPLVVQVGNVLVAIALGVLIVRVVSARRPALIALFTLSSAALLVLAWAFPLLLWPRLVALAGVGIAVLRTQRVTREEAAHALARGRQAGPSPAVSPPEHPGKQAAFTLR